MENKLYERFKEKFRSMLGIMAILILTVSALWFFSLASYFGKITIPFLSQNIEFPILFFVSVLEVAILVATPIVLSPFFQDYRALKKRQYKITKAEVIYFDFVENGTEPPTTSCYPILEDLQTGEKLKLDLDRDVEYEGKYLIYYLPKTKISIIVKRL